MPMQFQAAISARANGCYFANTNAHTPSSSFYISEKWFTIINIYRKSVTTA